MHSAQLALLDHQMWRCILVTAHDQDPNAPPIQGLSMMRSQSVLCSFFCSLYLGGGHQAALPVGGGVQPARLIPLAALLCTTPSSLEELFLLDLGQGTKRRGLARFACSVRYHKRLQVIGVVRCGA